MLILCCAHKYERGLSKVRSSGKSREMINKSFAENHDEIIICHSTDGNRVGAVRRRFLFVFNKKCDLRRRK